MSKPSRINVVGTSGSGKSTFSRKLAQRLGYPYLEMDQIHWGPNWKESPLDDLLKKLRIALAGDQWVLDGNYNNTREVKWERVDLIVWLDFSFPVTLYQAVKRAIQRAITQEELWEGTGNRESFQKSFLSKNSIILWTIKTYRSNRLRYERFMNDPKYAHIRFVRLRSRKEAEDFLEQATKSFDLMESPYGKTGGKF